MIFRLCGAVVNIGERRRGERGRMFQSPRNSVNNVISGPSGANAHRFAASIDGPLFPSADIYCLHF